MFSSDPDRSAHRSFLDSLGLAVWVTDDQGLCTFQNRAALEYTGREPADGLGRGWMESVHPEDLRRVLEHFAVQSHPGRQWRVQMRMLRADGEYRWLLLTMDPAFPMQGGFTGYVGYAVDVTNQKSGAEAIDDEQKYYREIVEAIGEGIWMLDSEWNTSFANHRMAEMLGYLPEEMIGAPVYQFLDEADVAAAKEGLERSRRGIRDKFDLKLLRKDGSDLWGIVSCVPLFDSLGHYKGALKIFTDVTDRKQTEELANRQTAALSRTLDLVANEPSLDTVMGHVLKAITEQLKVASSALYLHESEGDITSLHMTYHHGHVLKGEEAGGPLALDTVHVEHIAAIWRQQNGNTRPMVLDVQTSADLGTKTREWLLTNAVHTLLLVPLVVQHELVGTFSVRIEEGRSLKAAEVQLAQALAQQASLAVHLTRLAERARRVAVLEERNRATADRAAELGRANQALKQTLDILATEHEIDKVLGHVLTVTTQVLEGSGSTLWLKSADDETATIHLFYRDGVLLRGKDSGHRLAGETVSVNRNDLFALAVLRLGRPVWHEVEISEALDLSAKAYLKGQGVEALLGIPLILGDQTVGSIVVRFAHLRQFGSVELEMAQGLAQQATLALQLTRLAEQARSAAITEERNRMAREIHDTLAQGFTGILVQLQAAKQVLNGAHSELRAHVDSAMTLARQGLAEARRSVQGLRPELLRGGDIASAVKRLVNQLSSECSMRIRLVAEGNPPPMNSDLESNLLRIIQEAINNAVKHSGGKQISVNLNLEAEMVKLTVEDDGDGFDPHISTLSRGFGLISMQERADRIGGDLTILTKPGGGTKVHLLVPLSHPQKAGAAHP
jgi:PAS domain S-box-containing protein